MADLIDRQSVIDLLKKSASRDIEEVVVTEKNIKLIMDMPKAYDVEKVVAELESEVERWRESGEEYNDKHDIAVSEGFKRAVPIVRKGGVE